MNTLYTKKQLKNKGIKGSLSGDLYLERSEFFNRRDVKDLIDKLKKSSSLNSKYKVVK